MIVNSDEGNCSLRKNRLRRNGNQLLVFAFPQFGKNTEAWASGTISEKKAGKMKKKAKQAAKKRPLRKSFSYVASAVAGAMLFYFIMYQPIERELQQYELAYHLTYELTRSKEVSVTNVGWMTIPNNSHIPEGSLLIFTDNGLLHTVQPDGKASKHYANGAFIKDLEIRVPDAFGEISQEFYEK